MKTQISEILTSFEVSLDRGFLPDTDPITSLPNTYAAWDEMAELIPDLLLTGQFRKKIQKMPLLPINDLQDRTTLERAMLLLTFMGSAYIFAPPQPVSTIPQPIAVPWVAIAKKLGRMPIISHAEGVLNNWQRINPNGPISTKNLKPLVRFTGGFDESWFFLITVEIEMIGATAVRAIIDAQQCIKENKKAAFENCLLEFRKVLKKLTRTLKKIPDFCDPYIFYNRLRPFLASFENVVYEGVKMKPQSLSGGSAAQSSLIQTFDAALNIQHPNPGTGRFLQEMRRYMPPKHAAFIDYVAAGPSITAFAEKSKKLKALVQDCGEDLLIFRKEHLKIVAIYIMGQSKKTGPGDTGTGGTNPMIFLKEINKKTFYNPDKI